MYSFSHSNEILIPEREEEEKETGSISCYSVLFMSSKFRHVIFPKLAHASIFTKEMEGCHDFY